MPSTGPSIFWPNSLTVSIGTFTPVGASTALACLQKSSPGTPPDRSFCWSPLGPPASLAGLTFPSHNFFGDVQNVRFSALIAPYGIANQAGGSRDVALIDLTAAFVYAQWSIPASPSLNQGRSELYETTLTEDPRTSAAWTLDGLSTLLAGDIALFISLLPSGNETGIAISNLYITPSASPMPPTGGWHKGPHRRSRPRISDVTGLPSHRRDLHKVKDPRSPQYGKWMLPEDVDEINPEPTGPIFSEGDLDEPD